MARDINWVSFYRVFDFHLGAFGMFLFNITEYIRYSKRLDSVDSMVICFSTIQSNSLPVSRGDFHVSRRQQATGFALLFKGAERACTRADGYTQAFSVAARRGFHRLP